MCEFIGEIKKLVDVVFALGIVAGCHAARKARRCNQRNAPNATKLILETLRYC